MLRGNSFGGFLAMRTTVIALLFLAAACGKSQDPTATASTGPIQTPERGAPEQGPPLYRQAGELVRSVPLDLPARLDCLRQNGGVLLIGHRGGPTRDYPENALETFERTRKAGTPGMEIDIAQSKDGVLFLMHDEELDRTSTGEGPIASRTWDEISKLKLETYSKTTDFAPPTLDDTLAWAMRNGVLLELDKKRSASFDPIMAAVRRAKAEQNVFIITYTDDQAVEVHQKAPDLMITATVRNVAHLDELLARGVKADHLVAWTGNETPDPELWRTLADRGVESAFGTLGPRSTSLDGKYWEDDNGEEYQALADAGLAVLVVDMTDKVSRQLAGVRQKAHACGF
jgi:glycerophosphoryl diester phosphodiesterase